MTELEDFLAPTMTRQIEAEQALVRGMQVRVWT